MFEIISSYKGLVIALILTNGDLLKIELFDDTCAEFWNKHVVQHERKIKLPKQNHLPFKIRLLLVITVLIKSQHSIYCLK
jgi:hypothetical protein